MGTQTIRRALFVGMLLVFSQAFAQSWPSRPVRIISPTGPGLSADLVGRVLADKLSRQIGQQFYVDNIAGAATIVGAQAAARAAPDGYTLLIATAGTLANNPLVYKSLPYNPDRDFVPIAFVGDSSSFLIAVNNDLPARTLAELISLEKAKPASLSYAVEVSSGVAAMVGRYLNKQAGINMVEVGYKMAAQAVQDTMAGRTQVYLSSIAGLDPFIKAGKLRGIASSAESRTPQLPDIPVISETLPGFIITGFLVMVAPAGTPEPVLQRLNREVLIAAKEPDLVQKLQTLGFLTNKLGSLQATSEMLRVEKERWGRIIRELGIKAE